jgi:ribosome-associated toxin RatA of RatAB toxin-antitoxin module
MMRTVDRIVMRAAPETVWPLASQVERWPELLPHYRHVTRLDGPAGGDGMVEMSANRPFGPLQWPTWWRSAMTVDAAAREVRYRHVAGITTGMDVLWTIESHGDGWSDVTIVHTWDGPPWPGLRRIAAEWVIGPVFVHGIASRTLAGLARAAERGA